ncbi:nadh dehydrogenase 1 alpha subcomplex subunit 13 [Moniliophthora roreri]|nr:nadh dehydrogenase 1 alpha subcomplex subunit 13 [Moniliophthora roreri]
MMVVEKQPSQLSQDQVWAGQLDMPPPGGFEAIKYKRNLPFRGPGGLVILGGVAAVTAFGFYRYGQGALERRELQREKVWSRIHLVPLLMAEGDRDAYRRQQAALAREREIMKDVNGWEAGKSIYNNPKYATPEIVVL